MSAEKQVDILGRARRAQSCITGLLRDLTIGVSQVQLQHKQGLDHLHWQLEASAGNSGLRVVKRCLRISQTSRDHSGPALLPGGEPTTEHGHDLGGCGVQDLPQCPCVLWLLRCVQTSGLECPLLICVFSVQVSQG